MTRHAKTSGEASSGQPGPGAVRWRTAAGRVMEAAWLTLLAAPIAAAQSPPAQQPQPQSIAERISRLRPGWLYPATPAENAAVGRRTADAQGVGRRTATHAAPPARNAGPSPKQTANRGDGVGTRQRRRLPSLNPRDLLPPDLGSPRASTPNHAQPQPARRRGSAAAGVVNRPSSQAMHSVGSVRARIMRDLRKQGIDSDLRPSGERPARVQPRGNGVVDPAGITAGRGPADVDAGAGRHAGSPPHSKRLPPRGRDRAPVRAGSALSAGGTRVAQRTPPGGLTTDQLRRELAAPPIPTAPQLPPSVPAERATKRALTKSLAAEIAEELAGVSTAGAEDRGTAGTRSRAPTESESAPATHARTSDGPATDAGETDAGLTDPSAIADLPAASVQPPRTETADPPVISFQGVTGEGEVAQATPRADLLSSGETPGQAGDAPPRGAPHTQALITQRTPRLVSRVDGPRRIVVGREASYTVRLANRGDAAAAEMVARVRAPAWAEIASARSNRGELTRDAATSAGQTLRWRLDRFEAGAAAELELILVAREGKPVELGVDWRHAPVGATAIVQVQEPKLRVALAGPDDVVFGEPRRYELTFSNPGTGTAEDVRVLLVPPGKTAAEGTRHAVGSLAAGKTKTVRLELTAREAGELTIRAEASARGLPGVAAEKLLFCRKPGLRVDWRGPAEKYAGAAATYHFRVRNPGTADARDVTFVLDLPRGFGVQATSPDRRYDAAKRRLTWELGALRPGDDRYLQVRGVAHTAGAKEFSFGAATGDRRVADAATARTRVVAVADLRLDVIDPKGPLPVGDEVIYELRVKNRGAKEAENVKLVAMFSEGIEPAAVEGLNYSVSDGRVAMDAIAALPAGAEKVVRIRARADRPGRHVFRAELLCSQPQTRLAEEEMTTFYAEDAASMEGLPREAALDALPVSR